ncbi:MAG: hypothetical protein KGS72_13705 [Cyanobacteria bacterium REEB67]|nr:hypothetical protein [Cyanobacteria bacterium REEB67]
MSINILSYKSAIGSVMVSAGVMLACVAPSLAPSPMMLPLVMLMIVQVFAVAFAAAVLALAVPISPTVGAAAILVTGMATFIVLAGGATFALAVACPFVLAFGGGAIIGTNFRSPNGLSSVDLSVPFWD